mmetsp:Transcript_12649/g.38105  ORF Transcript_12649/g.38105 Transcript_12649/m.38105 type:complete len:251 (-) Transcript_12649:1028-1780(-)
MVPRIFWLVKFPHQSSRFCPASHRLAPHKTRDGFARDGHDFPLEAAFHRCVRDCRRRPTEAGEPLAPSPLRAAACVSVADPPDGPDKDWKEAIPVLPRVPASPFAGLPFGDAVVPWLAGRDWWAIRPGGSLELGSGPRAPRRRGLFPLLLPPELVLDVDRKLRRASGGSAGRAMGFLPISDPEGDRPITPRLGLTGADAPLDRPAVGLLLVRETGAGLVGVAGSLPPVLAVKRLPLSLRESRPLSLFPLG